MSQPQDPQQPPQDPAGQPVQPNVSAADQPAAAPAYGQQAGPSAPPPGQPIPGKTLGIVGLVLAFFCAIVGTVLSIVALVKSRKVGYTNVPAIIGIVVGLLASVGWGFGGASVGAVVAQCNELGSGVHQLDNGVSITCP